MIRTTSLIGVTALLLAAGCSERDVTPAPPEGVESPADTAAAPPSTPETSPPEAGEGSAPAALFTEITDDVRLDFRPRAERAGDPYYMPRLMGGGAAVLDADGDDDLDLILLDDGSRRGTRLLLQQPDGVLTDATDGSGLVGPADAMGCAVGDVDNDGDEDVYVTAYGNDRLFRSAGDGSFTDVTEASGIGNPGWGTSAAFLDFDRDGWLDLYVANYIELDEDHVCRDEAGRPDFCGPDFPGQADRLYRNRGDGTFADVTAASGVAGAAHAGLGVACADFNDDGWIDIYVANDKDPNLLWLNRGDGTFTEEAILLGLAFNGHGQAEAGMGVTAGDADNDGTLDLFVTHLSSETNTLYLNDERLLFEDVAGASGLGASSMPYTGWGTAFFDADLDGDLDLAVVNGAVRRRSPVLVEDGGFWGDYAEPNFFFRNHGDARFEPDDAAAGPLREDLAVSRGAIAVDFDRDGDQDLLVTNIDSPARLYRNETRSTRWLAIDTYDPALRRAALGARIVIRAGERSFLRHAIPPGGYLTGAPSTIHFGVPNGTTVTAIDVRWPDGSEERFEAVSHGRVVLQRGAGVSAP